MHPLSASLVKPSLSTATRFAGAMPSSGASSLPFYGQPAAPAASTFNAVASPASAFVPGGLPPSQRPSFQTAYRLAAPAPSVWQAPVAYGGVTNAVQATLQQNLPTTTSGMPSSALQGATLFNQNPEVEPLRASASKPLSASHSKHEALPKKEYKSFLKDPPFRYIGFMNEVAQAVGRKILGPLYAAAWGGELIYVTADGILDAKNRSAVTQGTAKEKQIMGTKEFVATVLGFQSLATLVLPTVVIDGAKEMAEKVITSKVAAKGIAGISKETIHKWTPVGLGLALIPPIVTVLDPTIEFGCDLLLRPVLGLPQREGSKAQALLNRFHKTV